MQIIKSFEAITPVPWANGAGETTELVSLDESERLTPGRRRWRLSIARLDHTGPFSSLPGLARTFLPVGAEVVLDIDGHSHRVTGEGPLRFHGEQSVELVELGHPCFALNLMVEDSSTAEVGAEFSRPDGGAVELSMSAPTNRGSEQNLFAVTVSPSPEHAQFQLLQLSGRGPAGLDLVYLS